MHKVLSFIIINIIFLSVLGFGQEDIQIGSLKYQQRGLTGFFDFSDPTGINMKVQVWGYVRFPGYYIIPARSNINDLISYAGGPELEANLDDIRILRTNLDSSTTLLKYDYNDLLWGENVKTPVKFPRLFAGDMVLVPGEPRYFSRETLSFYLSLISTLSIIASVIISITR